MSKSTLSHPQHTQSRGWQSWRNERPNWHSGAHLDGFQAEPMAFSSLKGRGKQGMQFKSIWAQCPQGGEMNSLNQNTPVPAHPVCAPSWHSPHRAPCRSPHHDAGPPAPGMSSPCAHVHRGHVAALLPQELQRDVPRSVGQRERGQTGRWKLRAPPRLKSKRWLTSASQACLGAAFVCMFIFAFVYLYFFISTPLKYAIRAARAPSRWL